jgi:hypothetical protein
MSVQDFLSVPMDGFAQQLADLVDRAGVARQYVTGGPALAAELDGRVVACCGVLLAGKGGEAWAMVDHTAARLCPVALTRAVRRGLDGIMEQNGLGSLVCTVHPADTMGRRWAGAVGFRDSGKRVDMGGIPYNLYVRGGA